MKLTWMSVSAAILFAVAIVITFMSMTVVEFFLLTTITMGTFCLGSLIVGVTLIARIALGSPDKDREKLPKYHIKAFMAVMVAVIVVGSATLTLHYVGIDPFERVIIRHADNETESGLLAQAEGLDYRTILSAERFNNATGEPRCRFIDKKVIDFYYDRVGELQARGPPNRASMSYEARVYPVETLQLKTDATFSPRFNFSFGPGDRYFWGYMEQGDDSRVAIWNGTAYNTMDARTSHVVDKVSSGGYLVVMKLKYASGPNPDDIQRTEARQYVYFDIGGNATWIVFERHEGIILGW